MLEWKKTSTSAMPGAQAFPDGSPPVIAHLTVDDVEAVAVYQPSGLFVIVSTGDEYQLSASTSAIVAVLGCAALRPRMTSADLRRLRFERVLTGAFEVLTSDRSNVEAGRRDVFS